MTSSVRLQDFLSSLAPITAIDYQIRNRSGTVLFSSNGDVPGTIPKDLLERTTRRIVENKGFRYDAVTSNHYVCGCPIQSGTKSAVALLAYGPLHSGHDPNQQRQHIELHLLHTVALIEENESFQIEIEDLALQLELSFEDLYLYSQISDQIKSLTLSKQMLNNLMMKIVENMHVDTAFIALPHRSQFDMEIYRPVTQFGPDNWEHFINDLQTVTRPQMDGAPENYIIVNDSRDHPAYRELTALPYRFLMVGVRHQEELYGWIGMASFNIDEIFRQGELRMLKSMAEQLAIVIANTDLYDNLEQFTESMVRSLVYAIEAKDPYTHGHSERVHHFTMLMARRLHMKDDDFEALKWSSILHDVGKIGISEEILLKPGKLTDEEFALIKEHPAKGGRILKPVAQLANSLGGIVHHHERYDGGGYPQGLRGEKIPLSARIIAVADTYDAITSNRTYRKAKTPQEAMDIIQSVAGTQLDPDIVKIFEEVYTLEPVR